MHTKNTAGARTRMPGAARELFKSPARLSEKKNITSIETKPMVRKTGIAIEKQSLARLVFPSALADETMRDKAAGTPAVAMAKTRAKTLYVT
jgi:hypothetical protein